MEMSQLFTAAVTLAFPSGKHVLQLLYLASLRLLNGFELVDLTLHF